MRKYLLVALIMGAALLLSQVVPGGAGVGNYNDSGSLQQAER
jgi:hypothetical protein